MWDINSDLSTLTNIPEKLLNKLNNKVLYIICQCIQEDRKEEKYISEFNFFDLFTLYINHDDTTQIRYRVVPNKTLETKVSATATNELNLLEDIINDTLASRFMDIYKDIC